MVITKTQRRQVKQGTKIFQYCTCPAGQVQHAHSRTAVRKTRTETGLHAWIV